MKYSLKYPLVAMLGIVLTGCIEESIVQVRFSHASPDAAAVDFQARGIDIVKKPSDREGTRLLPAV